MSERSERLFMALSEIDERNVDEAAPEIRVSWFQWKKWGTIAAAIALVVGIGGYILPRMGGNTSSTGAEGDAGADGASTFMSYAGPVFPLTLKEADNTITAERNVTFDFAPWVPVWWSNEEESNREGYTPEQRRETLEMYNEWYPAGGRWRSSSDIQVTDAYTLTNTSTEDKTVSVLYPFAGELREIEKKQPVLTMEGVRLETTLHAGDYSGGFTGAGGSEKEGRWNLVRLNSWEQYKIFMEDGGFQYQQSAFEAYPDLSDVPTIVYEFTDPQGDGTDAAAIQSAFDLDYGKTQVLSWGFNGGNFNRERGWMGMSFFIPMPQAPGYNSTRYLIVLGEDIGEMTIQGYANLGCEAGDERDFTVNVRRYETSLEDILLEVARQRYGWEEESRVDFEMFFGLMKENLVAYGVLSGDPAERYHDGRLEDLDFHYMDRVFYLAAEVTIPAGGSVQLTAEMTKEGSYDFYCTHTENQGVYGYDMVTELGSNLICTEQAAVLMDRGQIEIIRQNFGFDIENGTNRVSLDPQQEHYYLEVKGREDRFAK